MISFRIKMNELLTIILFFLVMFGGHLTVLAIDTDRDLLEDSEESSWGTDVNDPDSDDDGFLDGEEVENNTSPTNPSDYPNLTDNSQKTIFCSNFSILNTAPPNNAGTQQTIFCPNFTILNNAPPSVAGMQQTVFSPQSSVYNGDLAYQPGLPPYVTSVKLFDRNDEPYITSTEHTDEATVSVEVTTAWKVDSLIISPDDFSSSESLSYTTSFEYSFTDESEGLKRLWIKAMKDGIKGSPASDSIWLRKPQEVHDIEKFAEEKAGWILTEGAVEEWIFSGTTGQYVTVIVNPRSPYEPYLEYARVSLLSPSGPSIASAQNAQNEKAILAKVKLPETGEYHIQVAAGSASPNATGNYTLALYDSTPDMHTLVFNDRKFGSLERPYALDSWIFSSSADTLVQLSHHAASQNGLRYELRGPDDWFGFAVQDKGSDPVNLPYDGEYCLEAFAPDGKSDLDYSFTLESADVIEIIPGTPYTGATTINNEIILFRFELNDTKPLFVDFDATAVSGIHALYLRHHSPATRRDFNYKADKATADQRILVSNAYPGAWYLLLCVDRHTETGDFTLRIEQQDVILVSSSPSRYGASPGATITLEGLGFTPETSVELISETSVVIEPLEIYYVSSEKLISDWDLSIAIPGNWRLRVTQGLGQSEIPFTITSAGQADFWSNLILPPNLGRHALATIWIEYGNNGDAAMAAPLLILTATRESDGAEGAFLTLNESIVDEGVWTSATPEGFSHSIQILAHGAISGLIQPGESRKVPVYYIGWKQPWDFSNQQYNWNLGVVSAENTNLVDWENRKNEMRPNDISPEAWEIIWDNFTEDVGSTWGDYINMLSQNAIYLSRLGIDLNDASDLLNFEIAQSNGFHLLSVLESATDAYMPAPGLPAMIGRSFPNDISGRHRIGPFGRGWVWNWEYSLNRDTDGKVTLNGPGGTKRIFEPHRIYTGEYISQNGDRGKLTPLGNDRFALQERSGFTSVFDQNGRLEYVKNANDNRINLIYENDHLTTLTHALGQKLNIEWNGDRIYRITDSLGRETNFTYFGEYLDSVTYYEGSTISYDYTGASGAAAHALLKITYPGDYVREFEYDANGRLTGVHRGEDKEAVFFAFEKGEVRVSDALNKTTRVFFDHNSQPRKIIDPLNNAVTFDYDDQYNLTRITDPTGRYHSYSYDNKSNLENTIDALGNVTRFEHKGPLNRITLLTDANGNPTRYGYNAQGNLASITYADDTVERWSWRANGSPSGWANRRIQSIGYEFNSSGQLTAKRIPDGSSVRYVYNDKGNLIETYDESGKTILQHDALDRLIKIIYPYPAPPNNAWLEYTYNDAGQRTSMTDHLGNRLDYFYDDLGRLERLVDDATTDVAHYEYDDVGRLKKKTLGNGVYTDYEYDDVGQIAALYNRKSIGENISYFMYEYDSRGRRISMDTHYGKWTYEYDDIGQLIHAALDSTDPEIEDQDLTYEYDPLGNRILTIEDSVTTEYATNKMNQYTQVGDVTYEYDADGNMIREGESIYIYNTENQMIEINMQGKSLKFNYNALKDLWKKIMDDQITLNIHDPSGLSNLVYQKKSSGEEIRYFHGIGLIAEGFSKDNMFYYIFDPMGNMHQRMDHKQSTTLSLAFDPYGKRILINNNDLSIGFLGKYGGLQEINHSIYLRSRIYNSHIGRFFNPDPLVFQYNTYTDYNYCSNNPLSYVDIDGLFQLGSDDTTVMFRLFKEIGGESHRFQWMWRESLHHIAYHAERGFHYARGMAHYYWRYMWSPESGYVYAMGLKALGKRILLRLGVVGLAAWGGYTLGSIIEKPINQGFYETFYWLLTGELPPPDLSIYDSSKNGSTGSTTSIDPNEKEGPPGYGGEKYVSPNQLLPYTIHFENMTTATASAQIISIDDVLDENLDWTSFEITEIVIGELRMDVPKKTRRFDHVEAISVKDKDLELHANIGVNLSTGLLMARFVTIDPTTSLPPTVEYGILPPEDGSGRGQGHISYTIRSKTGIPMGTKIKNRARIVFDSNPFIETNEFQNTIGKVLLIKIKEYLLDHLEDPKGLDINKDGKIDIGDLITFLVMEIPD